VIQAVRQFELIHESILPADCRNNALRFSAERFHSELDDYIKDKWSAFSERNKVIY